MFAWRIKEKNKTMTEKRTVGKPPIVIAGTNTKIRNTGAEVSIGKRTVLGDFIVIYSGCVIGTKCLIGDGAKIRNDARIGNNCIVGMNTKIGAHTRIGNNVRIMDLCNIAGYTIIEDNVFIAQGTMFVNDNYMIHRATCGDNDDQYGVGPRICSGASIGANSTILAGIVVGENSIVGAGSVLTKNVPVGEMWFGNPAKFIKKLDI